MGYPLRTEIAHLAAVGGEGTGPESTTRRAGLPPAIPAGALGAREALARERGGQEWLLIEWPEGQGEPAKYFLTTAPDDATLEQMVFVTKMRWRIERDYQDLKQEFGLGHYEGRGWRGFHHHATLSVAAYAFLMAQRLKTGETARVKKNFIQRQVPAVSSDYVPRGSPSRAAPRGGLDHDTTPALERRTRKKPGPLPSLQLDR